MKNCIHLLILLLPSLLYSNQGLEDIISQTKEALHATKDIEQQARLSSDLAWYYAQLNADSSIHYGSQALDLANQSANDTLVGNALSDLSTGYLVKGDYAKSISYLRQSIHIRNILQDFHGVATAHFKMGNNFNRLNEYDSCMHYYFESLAYFETQEDSSIALNLLGNISATYFSMGNYPKALEYLEVPITYFKNHQDYTALSNSVMTLGNIRLAMKDTSAAIQNYSQAEEYATKSNNQRTLAAIYNNLSNIASNREEFDDAVSYILESIAIREELGLYSDLESSKLTLALNQFRMGDYQSAKPEMIKLKASFEEIQAKQKLKEVYLSLSYIYAYEKNSDSVNYYSKKYTELANLLNLESTLKTSEEIDVKYQTAKKEKEILLQRAQLAEQRFYILLFVALFLVSILLGYLFYKQQKLQNIQLIKENQLKDALLQIETQNKLQEQRLRISQDLHDNIGAQLTFVISSIDNLKYSLKDAGPKVEGKLDMISNFTRETIHELRDTIWAMNKSEISFEDLRSRISNFIDNANLSQQGINFTFQHKLKDPLSLVFSSQEGMHIYRVIQEAVNNAIKHAKANSITVNFEYLSKQLNITITDDGSGFDYEQVRQGNGLKSMQKRASKLRGEIIFKQLDKGSMIQLSFEKIIN